MPAFAMENSILHNNKRQRIDRDETGGLVTMQVEQIALKEWATVVNALSTGDQILMMRKGGIVEETKDFTLQSQSFFLFPTYEHQKKHLLKESFQNKLDETLKGWSSDNKTVTIGAYAEVIEDIEIYDQVTLNRLYPFHIWTEAFTEERLKWKKNNPLHLLILRVYKLEAPWKANISPAYLGCKSWIDVEQKAPEGLKLVPVLDQAAFDTAYAEIKRALDSN
jgi:hypothetical protein